MAPAPRPAGRSSRTFAAPPRRHPTAAPSVPGEWPGPGCARAGNRLARRAFPVRRPGRPPFRTERRAAADRPATCDVQRSRGDNLIAWHQFVTGHLQDLRRADGVGEDDLVAVVVQPTVCRPGVRQRAIGFPVAALGRGSSKRPGRRVRPAGADRVGRKRTWPATRGWTMCLPLKLMPFQSMKPSLLQAGRDAPGCRDRRAATAGRAICPARPAVQAHRGSPCRQSCPDHRLRGLPSGLARSFMLTHGSMPDGFRPRLAPLGSPP